MNMRSRLAVLCAKATASFIRKLNRGSGVTLPGYIARLIEPNILNVMSAMVSEKIIVTMGTNGKTTTNAILAAALEAEGNKVIINRTGANMLNGIISAFVLATNKQGQLHAQYACIEVDEIASVRVLPKLQPDRILLTNISRDQLDRFGEIDITFQTLKLAISGVSATLIINGDDVLSYSLALQSSNPFVTYGINQQIFDDFARSDSRDSIFCRSCGEKLTYQFYHYGHLGKFHCDCGLTHPKIDYSATQIVREEEVYSFQLADVTIRSTARTPYNIYNTLSAYATLQTLEISMPNLKSALESFDYGNNRECMLMIGNSRVQLHLAKNPIGFQQKISLILQDETPKDLILLINDTYQDGEDVSWLWDVDFQYLADTKAATITTAGTRQYDIGLRLKYEGILSDSTADLPQTLTHLLENGTKNIYIIVNYSGLYSTNRLLERLNVKKNHK